MSGGSVETHRLQKLYCKLLISTWGENTMKIVILQGSPLPKGNTTKVVTMLMERLSDSCSFETLRIAEKHIEFCDGCNYCQESGVLLNCHIQDEFISLIEKIKEADLVIYASPLYVFGLSAQLKRFVDRMYCTVKEFKTSKAESYLEGTKQMLLLTSIGPELVSEPCMAAFRLMTETQKGVSLGEFAVPFCKSEKRVMRNGAYVVDEMVRVIEGMDLLTQ